MRSAGVAKREQDEFLQLRSHCCLCCADQRQGVQGALTREHPAILPSLRTMECILAIDQGTQSSRVFLYDADARAIAAHQEEFAQIYPQKGCALASGALGSVVFRCSRK